MSIRLPRFHGLCQRCIHDQPEPLTLVKDLFLCDQHARNRQRALTRETRRKQAA